MRFTLTLETDLSTLDLITIEKIEREIRANGLNVTIDLPISGKFPMKYWITGGISQP